MERTGKMILSAVFGALSGLIIAFAVNRLYWWVGLASGGLVGYLSYEWRTVVLTVAELIKSQEKLAAIGRRLMAMAVAIGWAGGWAAMLAYPIIYVNCGPPRGEFFNVLAAFAAVSMVLVGIAFFFMFVFVIAPIDFLDDKRDEHAKQEMRFFLFSSSLIALFAMLPYGLYRATKKSPIAGKEIGRLSWKLLLMIHSENRMIVGFAALLGTAGGYVAKSFIAGAVIAAASVVLLKHVVADRWLKAHIAHR